MLIKLPSNKRLLKIKMIVKIVSPICFIPILKFISLQRKNSAKLHRNAKLKRIKPTVKSKLPIIKITNRETINVTINVMIFTSKIVFSFLNVFK